MAIDTEANRIRVVFPRGNKLICQAYAHRARAGNQWNIYERNRCDVFVTVARVSGRQSEKRQRAMVLAILKEVHGGHEVRA